MSIIQQRSYLNLSRSKLYYNYYQDQVAINAFLRSLEENKTYTNSILYGLSPKSYNLDNNNFLTIDLNPGSGIINNYLFSIDSVINLSIDLQSITNSGNIYLAVFYSPILTPDYNNSIKLQAIFIENNNMHPDTQYNLLNKNKDNLIIINRFKADYDSNNSTFTIEPYHFSFDEDNTITIDSEDYKLYPQDSITEDIIKNNNSFLFNNLDIVNYTESTLWDTWDPYDIVTPYPIIKNEEYEFFLFKKPNFVDDPNLVNYNWTITPNTYSSSNTTNDSLNVIFNQENQEYNISVTISYKTFQSKTISKTINSKPVSFLFDNWSSSISIQNQSNNNLLINTNYTFSINTQYIPNANQQDLTINWYSDNPSSTNIISPNNEITAINFTSPSQYVISCDITYLSNTVTVTKIVNLNYDEKQQWNNWNPSIVPPNTILSYKDLEFNISPQPPSNLTSKIKYDWYTNTGFIINNYSIPGVIRYNNINSNNDVKLIIVNRDFPNNKKIIKLQNIQPIDNIEKIWKNFSSTLSIPNYIIHNRDYTYTINDPIPPEINTNNLTILWESTNNITISDNSILSPDISFNNVDSNQELKLTITHDVYNISKVFRRTNINIYPDLEDIWNNFNPLLVIPSDIQENQQVDFQVFLSNFPSELNTYSLSYNWSSNSNITIVSQSDNTATIVYNNYNNNSDIVVDIDYNDTNPNFNFSTKTLTSQFAINADLLNYWNNWDPSNNLIVPASIKQFETNAYDIDTSDLPSELSRNDIIPTFSVSSPNTISNEDTLNPSIVFEEYGTNLEIQVVLDYVNLNSAKTITFNNITVLQDKEYYWNNYTPSIAIDHDINDLVETNSYNLSLDFSNFPSDLDTNKLLYTWSTSDANTNINSPNSDTTSVLFNSGSNNIPIDLVLSYDDPELTGQNKNSSINLNVKTLQSLWDDFTTSILLYVNNQQEAIQDSFLFDENVQYQVEIDDTNFPSNHLDINNLSYNWSSDYSVSITDNQLANPNITFTSYGSSNVKLNLAHTTLNNTKDLEYSVNVAPDYELYFNNWASDSNNINVAINSNTVLVNNTYTISSNFLNIHEVLSQNNFNYSWSTSDPNITFSNPNDQNTDVTFNDTGNKVITLTLSYSSYTSSYDFDLNVNVIDEQQDWDINYNPSIIEINNNSSYVNNELITFTLDTFPLQNIFVNWSVTDTSGITDVFSNNQSIDVLFRDYDNSRTITAIVSHSSFNNDKTVTKEILASDISPNYQNYWDNYNVSDIVINSPTNLLNNTSYNITASINNLPSEIDSNDLIYNWYTDSPSDITFDDNTILNPTITSSSNLNNITLYLDISHNTLNNVKTKSEALQIVDLEFIWDSWQLNVNIPPEPIYEQTDYNNISLDFSNFPSELNSANVNLLWDTSHSSVTSITDQNSNSPTYRFTDNNVTSNIVLIVSYTTEPFNDKPFVSNDFVVQTDNNYQWSSYNPSISSNIGPDFDEFNPGYFYLDPSIPLQFQTSTLEVNWATNLGSVSDISINDINSAFITFNGYGSNLSVTATLSFTDNLRPSKTITSNNISAIGFEDLWDNWSVSGIIGPSSNLLQSGSNNYSIDVSNFPSKLDLNKLTYTWYDDTNKLTYSDNSINNPTITYPNHGTITLKLDLNYESYSTKTLTLPLSIGSIDSIWGNWSPGISLQENTVNKKEYTLGLTGDPFPNDLEFSNVSFSWNSPDNVTFKNSITNIETPIVIFEDYDINNPQIINVTLTYPQSQSKSIQDTTIVDINKQYYWDNLDPNNLSIIVPNVSFIETNTYQFDVDVTFPPELDINDLSYNWYATDPSNVSFNDNEIKQPDIELLKFGQGIEINVEISYLDVNNPKVLSTLIDVVELTSIWDGWQPSIKLPSSVNKYQQIQYDFDVTSLIPTEIDSSKVSFSWDVLLINSAQDNITNPVFSITDNQIQNPSITFIYEGTYELRLTITHTDYSDKLLTQPITIQANLQYQWDNYDVSNANIVKPSEILESHSYTYDIILNDFPLYLNTNNITYSWGSSNLSNINILGINSKEPIITIDEIGSNKNLFVELGYVGLLNKKTKNIDDVEIVALETKWDSWDPDIIFPTTIKQNVEYKYRLDSDLPNELNNGDLSINWTSSSDATIVESDVLTPRITFNESGNNLTLTATLSYPTFTDKVITYTNINVIAPDFATIWEDWIAKIELPSTVLYDYPQQYSLIDDIPVEFDFNNLIYSWSSDSNVTFDDNTSATPNVTFNEKGNNKDIILTLNYDDSADPGLNITLPKKTILVNDLTVYSFEDLWDNWTPTIIVPSNIKQNIEAIFDVDITDFHPELDINNISYYWDTTSNAIFNGLRINKSVEIMYNDYGTEENIILTLSYSPFNDKVLTRDDIVVLENKQYFWENFEPILIIPSSVLNGEDTPLDVDMTDLPEELDINNVSYSWSSKTNNVNVTNQNSKNSIFNFNSHGDNQNVTLTLSYPNLDDIVVETNSVDVLLNEEYYWLNYSPEINLPSTLIEHKEYLFNLYPGIPGELNNSDITYTWSSSDNITFESGDTNSTSPGISFDDYGPSQNLQVILSHTNSNYPDKTISTNEIDVDPDYEFYWDEWSNNVDIDIPNDVIEKKEYDITFDIPLPSELDPNKVTYTWTSSTSDANINNPNNETAKVTYDSHGLGRDIKVVATYPGFTDLEIIKTLEVHPNYEIYWNNWSTNIIFPQGDILKFVPDVYSIDLSNIPSELDPNDIIYTWSSDFSISYHNSTTSSSSDPEISFDDFGSNRNIKLTIEYDNPFEVLTKDLIVDGFEVFPSDQYYWDLWASGSDPEIIVPNEIIQEEAYVYSLANTNFPDEPGLTITFGGIQYNWFSNTPNTTISNSANPTPTIIFDEYGSDLDIRVTISYPGLNNSYEITKLITVTGLVEIWNNWNPDIVFPNRIIQNTEHPYTIDTALPNYLEDSKFTQLWETTSPGTINDQNTKTGLITYDNYGSNQNLKLTLSYDRTGLVDKVIEYNNVNVEIDYGGLWENWQPEIDLPDVIVYEKQQQYDVLFNEIPSEIDPQYITYLWTSNDPVTIVDNTVKDPTVEFNDFGTDLNLEVEMDYTDSDLVTKKDVIKNQITVYRLVDLWGNWAPSINVPATIDQFVSATFSLDLSQFPSDLDTSDLSYSWSTTELNYTFDSATTNSSVDITFNDYGSNKLVRVTVSHSDPGFSDRVFEVNNVSVDPDTQYYWDDWNNNTTPQIQIPNEIIETNSYNYEFDLSSFPIVLNTNDLTYNWTIPSLTEGSDYTISDSSSPQPSITFNTYGDIDLNLELAYSGLNNTYNYSITLDVIGLVEIWNNWNPTITHTQTIYQGIPNEFGISESLPSALDLSKLTYTWESTEPNISISDINIENPDFTFENFGSDLNAKLTLDYDDPAFNDIVLERNDLTVIALESVWDSWSPNIITSPDPMYQKNEITFDIDSNLPQQLDAAKLSYAWSSNNVITVESSNTIRTPIFKYTNPHNNSGHIELLLTYTGFNDKTITRNDLDIVSLDYVWENNWTGIELNVPETEIIQNQTIQVSVTPPYPNELVDSDFSFNFYSDNLISVISTDKNNLTGQLKFLDFGTNLNLKVDLMYPGSTTKTIEVTGIAVTANTQYIWDTWSPSIEFTNNLLEHYPSTFNVSATSPGLDSNKLIYLWSTDETNVTISDNTIATPDITYDDYGNNQNIKLQLDYDGLNNTKNIESNNVDVDADLQYYWDNWVPTIALPDTLDIMNDYDNYEFAVDMTNFPSELNSNDLVFNWAMPSTTNFVNSTSNTSDTPNVLFDIDGISLQSDENVSLTLSYSGLNNDKSLTETITIKTEEQIWNDWTIDIKTPDTIINRETYTYYIWDTRNGAWDINDVQVPVEFDINQITFNWTTTPTDSTVNVLSGGNVELDLHDYGVDYTIDLSIDYKTYTTKTAQTTVNPNINHEYYWDNWFPNIITPATIIQNDPYNYSIEILNFPEELTIGTMTYDWSATNDYEIDDNALSSPTIKLNDYGNNSIFVSLSYNSFSSKGLNTQVVVDPNNEYIWNQWSPSIVVPTLLDGVGAIFELDSQLPLELTGSNFSYVWSSTSDTTINSGANTETLDITYNTIGINQNIKVILSYTGFNDKTLELNNLEVLDSNAQWTNWNPIIDISDTILINYDYTVSIDPPLPDGFVQSDLIYSWSSNDATIDNSSIAQPTIAYSTSGNNKNLKVILGYAGFSDKILELTNIEVLDTPQSFWDSWTPSLDIESNMIKDGTYKLEVDTTNFPGELNTNNLSISYTTDDPNATINCVSSGCYITFTNTGSKNITANVTYSGLNNTNTTGLVPVNVISYQVGWDGWNPSIVVPPDIKQGIEYTFKIDKELPNALSLNDLTYTWSSPNDVTFFNSTVNDPEPTIIFNTTVNDQRIDLLLEYSGLNNDKNLTTGDTIDVESIVDIWNNWTPQIVIPDPIIKDSSQQYSLDQSNIPDAINENLIICSWTTNNGTKDSTNGCSVNITYDQARTDGHIRLSLSYDSIGAFNLKIPSRDNLRVKSQNEIDWDNWAPDITNPVNIFQNDPSEFGIDLTNKPGFLVESNIDYTWGSPKIDISFDDNSLANPNVTFQSLGENQEVNVLLKYSTFEDKLIKKDLNIYNNALAQFFKIDVDNPVDINVNAWMIQEIWLLNNDLSNQVLLKDGTETASADDYWNNDYQPVNAINGTVGISKYDEGNTDYFYHNDINPGYLKVDMASTKIFNKLALLGNNYYDDQHNDYGSSPRTVTFSISDDDSTYQEIYTSPQLTWKFGEIKLFTLLDSESDWSGDISIDLPLNIIQSKEASLGVNISNLNGVTEGNLNFEWHSFSENVTITNSNSRNPKFKFDDYGTNKSIVLLITSNGYIGKIFTEAVEVEELVEEINTYQPSETNNGDYLGSSLLFNNDATVLYIGAEKRDNSKGKVYECDSSNKESLTTISTIQPSVLNDDDRFGRSISLDENNNILSVGAYKDNRLYFLDSSSTYSSISNFNNINSNSNDGFGVSNLINKDKNLLIVGAHNYNSQGIVYFYDIVDIYNPSLIKTLVIGGIEDFDNYGISLSSDIDFNRLVIGASNKNKNGKINNGAVYIYDISDISNIQLLKTLSDSDLSSNDGFGISVSTNIDASLLAVGAYKKDDLEDVSYSSVGKVYLYNILDINNVKFISSFYPDSPNSFSYFGYSTALTYNGSHLAVGALYNDLIYIYKPNNIIAWNTWDAKIDKPDMVVGDSIEIKLKTYNLPNFITALSDVNYSWDSSDSSGYTITDNSIYNPYYTFNNEGTSNITVTLNYGDFPSKIISENFPVKSAAEFEWDNWDPVIQTPFGNIIKFNSYDYYIDENSIPPLINSSNVSYNWTSSSSNTTLSNTDQSQCSIIFSESGEDQNIQVELNYSTYQTKIISLNNINVIDPPSQTYNVTTSDSIQTKIDNANDHDIIHLDPGNYIEDIIINKPITLEADKDITLSSSVNSTITIDLNAIPNGNVILRDLEVFSDINNEFVIKILLDEQNEYANNSSVFIDNCKIYAQNDASVFGLTDYTVNILRVRNSDISSNDSSANSNHIELI